MHLFKRALAAFAALCLATGPALAADNFAVTVGAGKTIACKEIATVCYGQHIVVDATGTAITSTAISSKQRLDVTLASGGVPGSAAPNFIDLMGGTDGTNARAFLTDTSGRLAVNVNTSALPTGAATSANQMTANSSLSSIDGKTLAPYAVTATTTINAPCTH